MTDEERALLIFQEQVEPHLDAIGSLLHPRAQLTLVVRMPWLADGDIILTRDDLEAVEATIRDHRTRQGQ